MKRMGSRAGRWGSGLALTFAWTLSSSVAVGQSHLHMETEGPCPNKQDLEASVARWAPVLTEGTAGVWSLEVRRGIGETYMVLRTPRGEAALERTFRSDECMAIARAIAHVVQAYFTESDLIDGKDGDAKREEDAILTAPEWVWIPWVGLGLGAAASPEVTLAGLGRLDLGFRNTLGWFGGLGLSATSPTMVSTPLHDVRRWTSGLDARVGLRIGQSLWFQPAMGLGVRHAQLSPQDGTETVHAQTRMTVGLDMEFGARIANRWSVFSLVGLEAWPWRERYLLGEPCQPSDGPRAEARLLIGTQFDIMD